MSTRACFLAILALSLACSKHDFSSHTDKRPAEPGRNDPIDMSRPDPAKPNPESPTPKDPNDPYDGGNSPNNPYNPNAPTTTPGTSPGGDGPLPSGTPPGGTTPGGTTPGDKPTSGGPTQVERVLPIACGNDATNAAKPEFTIEAAQNVKVITTIKGELCPESLGHLRVVFLVDFSASMGRHDTQQGRLDHPGHDPMVNATCGRYEAMATIVRKLKPFADKGAQIEVALVPFSDAIVTPYLVAPMPLATFMTAALTAEKVCGHVLQDAGQYASDAGSIAPTSSFSSGTKYEAPFVKAREILSEKVGRGLVYLITDGEPNDPSSGRAAAAALGKLPNVTVNALLLSHDAANAREILAAVTPDASPGDDRIKNVAEADQLKIAIDQFAALKLNPKSGTASLLVPSYNPADLGLVSYADGTTLQAVGNAWKYETQPFVLLGRVGETVVNTVIVRGRGLDGALYQSNVTIQYRMK